MTLRVDPAIISGDLPEAIGRRLRAELGEEVFTSWFGRLALDRIADGTAEFSVPTKFLKTWIVQHYQERLLTIVAAEMPEVTTVSVVIRTSAALAMRQVPALAVLPPAAAPIETAAAMRAPAQVRPASIPTRDADPVPSSPLDRRLTFATFQAGPSNRLALTAAKIAAEHDPAETPRWSPLFVHGPVGLGKTHLLQAIAQDAAARGRRVVYLTAEKFMYGFALALKAQTMLVFQERLRDIDILLIDDAQFLQGKSVQQEFTHTLNAMVSPGKQIVVAADRPPQDLEHLEDRVRSRLAGGLTVEVGAHDRDVRLGILRGLVESARGITPAFDLPEPVLEHVADLIQSNGRDLAGAVNRLVACFCLAAAPLTVESAEVAIRDLVRQREPKRVRIEDIQKLVATHYGLSRNDLMSSRRTANVVRPRQIAMYLSKVMTLRSLPEIGRRFGGRDHTTVLHAVRKIEGLTGSDDRLGEELRVLKAMLED